MSETLQYNSSEFVPHESNHAKEVAVFMASHPEWADPVTRRDYFEHLNEEDFIDLLQQVNATVRTGNWSQRQYFDGSGKNQIPKHDVPAREFKETLLKKTWRTVREKFLLNREMSDNEALVAAATTVAGAFLYIHPNKDGNGRTARALSFIMEHGKPDEFSLIEMFKKSSGKNEWHVMPINFPIAEHPFTPDNLPFSLEDLPVGLASQGFTGERAKVITLYDFIEKFGDELKDQLVSYCKLDKNDNLFLDTEALQKFIDQSGLGWQLAYEKVDKQSKVRFIERYLEIMTSDKERPFHYPIIVSKENWENYEATNLRYQRHVGDKSFPNSVGRAATFGQVLDGKTGATPLTQHRVWQVGETYNKHRKL